MIINTKQEYWNISEGYTLDGKEEFDWKYEEIESQPLKQNTITTFVIKSNNKYYLGYIESEYNEGVFDHNFPMILTEVEPVEIKTIQWRRVK